VLGVPFNSDGTPPAVEHPPQRLREAGLISRLTAEAEVHDLGDLPLPVPDGTRDAATGVLNWPAWQTVTDLLAARVKTALTAGAWPLILGGDCSILTGILAGAAEAGSRCGLLFVDGHGDFHTPDTSPTGEPADMVLAVLTGRGPNPISSGVSTDPLLRDGEVMVYGLREWDGIRDSTITVLDKERLLAEDLVETARQSITVLGRDRPMWLHLDVDVIDPSLMPVLFSATDGLTFEEARVLLQALLDAAPVIGMNVACFHPNLDHTGSATAALVDLLTDLLTS
jgi:arginase